MPLCEKWYIPQRTVRALDSTAPDILLHEILDTPEEVARFLWRTLYEKEFLKTVSKWSSTSLASQFSELASNRPSNLKDSCLMDLIEKKAFGSKDSVPLPNFEKLRKQENFKHLLSKKNTLKAYDPKLLLCAFLISRGLTTKDQIERVMPAFPVKDFHRYQAKVHRMIEMNLSGRSKKFQSYWGSLTRAQQEAVRIHYFENEEDDSVRVSAKKLKISADSLKDRLDGAIKKLQSSFPEYSHLDIARPKGYWTKLSKPKNRENYIDRKEQKILRPLYRIHPKTLSRKLMTMKQAKASKKVPNFYQVKRWLELTSYYPRHNGVESSLYAHMANVSQKPRGVVKGISASY